VHGFEAKAASLLHDRAWSAPALAGNSIRKPPEKPHPKHAAELAAKKGRLAAIPGGIAGGAAQEIQ
jgi:hypothetical protein